MAWHQPGDKPLPEPMMVSSLTHICVTRPQWVNGWMLVTYPYSPGLLLWHWYNRAISHHYSDVIVSAMASQIPSISIVCLTVFQAEIKENIKALPHWPLWGESTGDRWIPSQRASDAENVSMFYLRYQLHICYLHAFIYTEKSATFTWNPDCIRLVLDDTIFVKNTFLWTYQFVQINPNHVQIGQKWITDLLYSLTTCTNRFPERKSLMTKMIHQTTAALIPW